MIEIILKSIRCLFLNKLRLILSISGIAVGVAAVTLMISIGDYGRAAVNNEIDSLGMGGTSIKGNDDSVPLTVRELDTIRSSENVSSVLPLVFEATNVSVDNRRKDVYLWGLDVNADKTISMKLISGRFFNSTDISKNARVCVVDQKFAENNFTKGNYRGKKIMINSGNSAENYTVIGVMKTGGGLLENTMGGLIPDFICIPYSTMQQNISSNNFTQIIVKGKSSDTDYDKLGDNIIKALERTGNRKNSYIAVNMAKQKQDMNSIIGIFSFVLSAAAAISLVVAGINIMNMMLISVNERTKEIGIKKSLGASDGVILCEFLFEAAVINLTGCITGLIVGNLISFVLSAVYGLTFILRIDIIVLMLSFTLLLGGFFGIYPALKAASLKPVDALRYY